MPYLKHKPTGDLYPWHEILAKREDMELYEPPIPAKPGKQKSSSPIGRVLDNMVEQIDDSLRAS
jgi:hypothetical protein